MNLFGVSWSSLDLSPPSQTRISAQTIKKWHGGDQLLRQVRSKAARSLLRARRLRVDTRQSGRQYFQVMRKRAQAQTENYYKEVQDRAVQESLNWLVDTAQIEQEIASHLAQKAHDWAIAAFKVFVGQLDNQQMLLEQLRAPVAQAREHGALTLHVNPEQVVAVGQAFGELSQLTVVSDPSLKPTQAVLESHLLLVKIDLERHLNLLIEQLRQHLPGSSKVGKQNNEQKVAPPESADASQASEEQEVEQPEPSDSDQASEEQEVAHE